MIYGSDLTPYTFILQHFNFLTSVFSDTRGLHIFYKFNNRYYITAEKYYEFYLLSNFDDGLVFPNDLMNAMKVLDLALKDKDLSRQYPLFTKYSKTGYNIIINGRDVGYVPIVTTNSKFSIFIAKKLIKSLKFIEDLRRNPAS